MKQANKRPVGRPKIDAELKAKFKTLPVICSPEEYEAVLVIARNLKYRSLSALLRSAISKGIWVSADKGLLTYPQDKIYWEFWQRNWNFTKHLSDNTEHIELVEKAKKNEIINKPKK
jgi:hypothetical protein